MLWSAASQRACTARPSSGLEQLRVMSHRSSSVCGAASIAAPASPASCTIRAATLSGMSSCAACTAAAAFSAPTTVGSGS